MYTAFWPIYQCMVVLCCCCIVEWIPRCSLVLFGWVPSMETPPNGIDFGPTVESCWKKWWSKAREWPTLCWVSACLHLLASLYKYNIIYTYIYIYVGLYIYIHLHFSLVWPGGQLSREALRSLPGSSQGLVRKYIDKGGKRRHVGVASRLKRSQCLISI